MSVYFDCLTWWICWFFIWFYQLSRNRHLFPFLVSFLGKFLRLVLFCRPSWSGRFSANIAGSISCWALMLRGSLLGATKTAWFFWIFFCFCCLYFGWCFLTLFLLVVFTVYSTVSILIFFRSVFISKVFFFSSNVLFSVKLVMNLDTINSTSDMFLKTQCLSKIRSFDQCCSGDYICCSFAKINLHGICYFSWML